MSRIGVCVFGGVRGEGLPKLQYSLLDSTVLSIYARALQSRFFMKGAAAEVILGFCCHQAQGLPYSVAKTSSECSFEQEADGGCLNSPVPMAGYPPPHVHAHLSPHSTSQHCDVHHINTL